MESKNFHTMMLNFLVIVLSLHAPGATVVPGRMFIVGGLRGWRVPDGVSPNYDQWAEHNRFRVGDMLHFKYHNDTVLVVDRAALDACNACNTTAPLATFSEGATTILLEHLGFYCFISDEPGHCEHGQRLVVRVLAQRQPTAKPPAHSRSTGSGGQIEPSSASSGSTDTVVATAWVTVAMAAVVLFGVI